MPVGIALRLKCEAVLAVGLPRRKPGERFRDASKRVEYPLVPTPRSASKLGEPIGPFWHLDGGVQGVSWNCGVWGDKARMGMGGVVGTWLGRIAFINCRYHGLPTLNPWVRGHRGGGRQVGGAADTEKDRAPAAEN